MICESWEGSTIDGKFPLLEWLGGWADHCVFLTVRQGTQRANIKLTPASGAEADAHLAYWETAKGLSHPSLLQLMESGRCTIQGTEVVYVITEKTDNFLSSLIPRKELDASEVKEFLEPVADALMFLHEKGFGHGSVRPSNIVQVGTQWKLTSEKMSSGENQGKAPNGYDAPETTSGEMTPASDVWSLGMIVVEAFQQRTAPWDSESKNDPVVPRSLPQPFFDIARGCLRWDPAGRISIAEVKALLAKESLPAPVDEPVAHSSEPIAVEPKPKVEAEEESPAETPIPFAQTERVEFAPRSRLFTNLGEIEERSGRGRWLSLITVSLVGIAVLAVYGYRSGWLGSMEANHQTAQSQPVPQLQAPQNPAPQNPVPQNPVPQNPVPQNPEAQNGSPAQNSGAPEPQQAQPSSDESKQSAPPDETKTTGPPSTQPQPTPSAAPVIPEPKTPRPAPAPVKPESHPSEPAAITAADEKSGIEKQVLPAVSPGATASMRGPVDVELHVAVNSDGSVANVEYVTQGPGNYFARIARQAAQSWKFKPTGSEGETAHSQWVVLFRFDRRKVEATATKLH